MVKPYAGLWDPKGFLGRFLKPAEPLIYQPPTVGVAYVPVQKVRSANSADNSPNRPTSWADSIRQSQEHLVGSSRAPQRTTRIRPSSRNCNRRQAPPMGRPSLLGSVIKPASTLVGATKKPPVSNPDTEPTPSATSIETVGEPQQPESSSAIEGCVRQCLKD
ncbi:unnamed protein product [Hermetia illucens]|uniref:Uncharacterized protein n=2 Tax=Hermetia illucens TaxID=343691 RepID=A0A7R8V833_HERIL|nr:unnamed protein product [Hermetia illucens]